MNQEKYKNRNNKRQEYQNQKGGTPLLAKRTITRTLEQYKKISNTLDVRI